MNIVFLFIFGILYIWGIIENFLILRNIDEDNDFSRKLLGFFKGINGALVDVAVSVWTTGKVVVVLFFCGFIGSVTGSTSLISFVVDALLVLISVPLSIDVLIKMSHKLAFI